MDGHRISIAASATKPVWQIAVLMAAGAISFASPAEASRYYWSDYQPGFFQSRPAMSQEPRQRVRPRQVKKAAAPKDTAKPQGPLIIAISIDSQTLKVYDANGLFAETPISTGMKGHPTPMGVFSVIQKRRFHHSNIYSGAPMPFMQRMTWSGIAMHAGALPGYPASHGCIRMPMAFAARVWNWTKTGARVVVTPGEITPVRFSHPLLAEQKVAPLPTAAYEPNPNAPPAVKGDKAANVGVSPNRAAPASSLELRPTVGHNVGKPPGESSPSRSVRNQARTADASTAITTANASVMSDASSAARSVVSALPEATTTTARSIAPIASAKADDAPEIAVSEGARLDESVTAATEAGQPVPDAQKDQTRLPNVEKAVVVEPEPPKPAGRIAVMVSRKDGKLYVRENFKPLFDTPVTIAPSDRLLGTHVFTVQVDKDDANVLRWSVVSLPVLGRNMQKEDDDERSVRRRKIAGVVPADIKPIPGPNSPAEALDRITIPPDAMARIAEALGTGGSIVVSDHGIDQGGETGEGTDFIVPLR